MIAGIHGNETLHIIQRMSVALGTVIQAEGQLVAGVEHLTNLRLSHRSVDVGQLVIDGLHQTTNGFIDPCADLFAIHTCYIAVDIDGRPPLGWLSPAPHTAPRR